MLYEEFMVPCAKAVRTRVADGEGGWTTAWAEGEEFVAAIVKDSSANVLIAEAQGVTGVYTVVTPKDTPLTFHEAFTRLSDGKSFRISTTARRAWPRSSSASTAPRNGS